MLGIPEPQLPIRQGAQMQTSPLSHTIQDNARQKLGAQLCAPTGGVHGQIGQIHISWCGRLRLHEGESQEIPLFVKDTQTPSSGPIPPIVGQISASHPPLIKGLFKDVLDRLVVIYAELLDMWCHSGVPVIDGRPLVNFHRNDSTTHGIALAAGLDTCTKAISAYKAPSRLFSTSAARFMNFSMSSILIVCHHRRLLS